MGTAVPTACPQSSANRHPTLLTHLHNMTMRTSLTAIRTAYRRSFGSRATPPVVDSILDTIGNTPVVRLNKLVQPWAQSNNLEAMLKLESLNPGWSVKARPALNMLEQAESRGELKRGMRITESSSGNTAIALAMACAVKGYAFEPVVDIKMPVDKLNLLKVYGANPKVVGSSPDEDMGALKIERRELVAALKADPEYYVPDQYNNPDNAGSHLISTGPEFVAQCGGKMDLAVVMMSTGGQVGGIGRYLKETIPGLQLLAVEPSGSTIYGKNKGSYLNTGGGLDYKPGVVVDLEADMLVDNAMVVEDDDALAVCRTLAQHDGILVGPSTGMAIFAGLKAAELDPSIQRIGFLGCDDGRAYMNYIMKDFNVEMDHPMRLRERVQATDIETYVVNKQEIVEPPSSQIPIAEDAYIKQPAANLNHSQSAVN